VDWIYPIFGYAGMPCDKRASAKARGAFLAHAGVLERELAGRTYLVGQAVSLADVVVAAAFVQSYCVVRTGCHLMLQLMLLSKHQEASLLRIAVHTSGWLLSCGTSRHAWRGFSAVLR